MSTRLLSATAILLLLFFVLPRVALAQSELKVTGVVTSLQSAQGTFTLQELSGNVAAGRVWIVRVTNATECCRGDNFFARGTEPTLRLLKAGDVLVVEGRLVGNRVILADLISLRAHAGAFRQPPATYPFQGRIIILAPPQGAEVPAGEFAVIGRTIPGAEVRIEVSGRYGMFTVGVASGTVIADQSGVFVFPVRPRLRVPGTVYTISVSSTFQGYAWPPVSITVRQH